ncbi:lariat debranching enzyme A-like [Schistocerca gregaria]|uniref:lariat debranching enzyme A-like n=1 Tax=Schistocerca gregaria TaxID=7010 RepID=UPI00211F0E46|nr:lariat debranching enzyme A-like [Schistocerca gregaria]
MKIAVEGCAHGELDAIYETLTYIMEKEGIKIDLLICCGDFQCPRNERDLESMAVPNKYLSLGSFYKYYTGEKKAPVLTLFVHGNHESINYLKELYFGGWVAPNIYYMGYSGVVNVNGIRIGGLSGIYKEHDYYRGHYEVPPYTSSSIRSAYHIREFEVYKLSHISGKLDIMISHDWPRGIYQFGDVSQLLKKKPFFRREIESNTLGNPAAEWLLNVLRPSYWFAAHLHVKFPALVLHENGQTTRFLALDKCLPRRSFLQILDFPSSQLPTSAVEYDPEWLAILYESQKIYSTSYQTIRYNQKLDLTNARQHIQARLTDLASCQAFPFQPESEPPTLAGPFENSQTRLFIEAFQLPSNTLCADIEKKEPPTCDQKSHENPEEILIDL